MWEAGVKTKGTPGRQQGRRMSLEEQQGERWKRQLLGVRRGRERGWEAGRQGRGGDTGREGVEPGMKFGVGVWDVG